MRITDVQTVSISIPYKQAIVSSFRGRQQGCQSILVRVLTPFGGPPVQEIWNGEKIVCMNLLQANLK